MEAVAKLNDFPTSPRKARLVADLIRGKKVNLALGILSFQPQQAAPVIKKVLMSAVAKLNDFPTSPRKARLVADLIRGKKVNLALGILSFQPQQAAPVIKKVLMSAVANWQNKNEDLKIEDADLYVKTIMIDGGRVLKRLRPAPQGRAYRVRKRSQHITIVVDSLENQTA